MNEDRITSLRDWQPVNLVGFTASMLRVRRQPMPRETAEGPVLQAEINHGRYLVRCPSCAGAELVDLEDPRFFCLSCMMVQCGGKWLPVKLPSAAHRAKLEAELMKRTRQENRNWLPGETLKQLRGENAAHGIGGDN